jgi:hypothetical protein
MMILGVHASHKRNFHSPIETAPFVHRQLLSRLLRGKSWPRVLHVSRHGLLSLIPGILSSLCNDRRFDPSPRRVHVPSPFPHLLLNAKGLSVRHFPSIRRHLHVPSKTLSANERNRKMTKEKYRIIESKRQADSNS